LRDFASNEEFLQALRSLIDRIEAQGNIVAARQLREGFACPNGLTDGWAWLVESIDKTVSDDQSRIDARDMSKLRYTQDPKETDVPS
jgi:hypothetical protein